MTLLLAIGLVATSASVVALWFEHYSTEQKIRELRDQVEYLIRESGVSDP